MFGEASEVRIGRRGFKTTDYGFLSAYVLCRVTEIRVESGGQD